MSPSAYEDDGITPRLEPTSGDDLLKTYVEAGTVIHERHFVQYCPACGCPCLVKGVVIDRSEASILASTSWDRHWGSPIVAPTRLVWPYVALACVLAFVIGMALGQVLGPL